MKAVISGDWHIGVNPRYKGHTEDIRKSIQYVVDYAIQIKASVFIIAGDGLHRPVRIASEDLLFLRDIFHNLVDNGINIYYGLGNHDPDRLREPIVKVWEWSGLVKFVDSKNYMAEGLIEDFGYTRDILLVPFLIHGDPLPSYPNKGHRLTILHQTVGGVHFQNGLSAEEMADNHHERIFLNEDLTALESNQFISGHIHRKQTVKTGNHKVQYMGSTCILNFGEINSGNTFIVASPNDNGGFTLKSHSIPQRRWIKCVGLPEELESDAIYKLVLTKQEAERLNGVRHLFAEVGSQIVSVEIEKESRRMIKKREVESGFLDMPDDEKLRSWLDSIGIETPEPYLSLDKEIREAVSL